MRVVIEKPPEGGEEELIVRVNQLSERVLELLRVIQAEDEKLMCYHEDGSLSVLCPSSGKCTAAHLCGNADHSDPAGSLHNF